MIQEYDHSDIGRVRVPGNPIKMSEAPGNISLPAPRLGEHTESVLDRMLKLPAEKIAQRPRDGTIGSAYSLPATRMCVKRNRFCDGAGE